MSRGIEVTLEQNTEEWLRWREDGIGGSDAPVIMMQERHPYSSPDDLYLIKTKQKDGPEENDAMRRGHELEPVARDLYIRQTGIHMRPSCFENQNYRFMRSSVDGISPDGRTIVEIKAPNDRAHKDALAGKVPYYYLPQCHHNMLVTGADVCHYWSYSDRSAFTDETRTALVPVYRDEAYLQELIKKEVAFWKCVVQKTPPSEILAAGDSGLVGLIQIAGYARAGKDTVGSVISKLFDAKRYGYADSLKRVVIDMGLWNGDEKTKEKARKHLINLGQMMRTVDANVWVNGVFNPTSGIFESMLSTGAVITDCRKVNEDLCGRREADRLGAPYRLFWIERPDVGPVHESERDETRHLRNLADRIIINNFELRKRGKGLDTKPLQKAVLAAMSASSNREIFVSDYAGKAQDKE